MYNYICLPLSARVLDIEPESENEDAILERRRQLRKAIEQKYQSLKSNSANPSEPTSPAKSEASSTDSDAVGAQTAK